ncbi:MAG: MATE family efflux transporter [Blautia sp.]|nr:MATE family efflux transporter [Blautia sp.]
MENIRRKYFGDKAFYFMVLGIAVPIMIQNGITNFVGMLDNIMIGRVGTGQMSGASIVNQLIMVYNLCIFGGISGAGIFTAQYFGQGQQEGIRATFRFKLWLAAIVTILTTILFLTEGSGLINLYLSGEGTPQQRQEILTYGLQYLHIMLAGLPAFMLAQVYAGTLRECGETLMPMTAGITAVFVNLVFNYLLIYGKFGFPRMGVAGAAAATVLSRYVECFIIVLWTHTKGRKLAFVEGLYSTMKVPRILLRKFIVTGMPLLINETLWSGGVAMLAQCYSVRGLDVVAALNISNTITNLFNIVLISMGNSVAIIVGQLLGAGRLDEARDTDRKLICMSVMLCILPGLIMFLIAPLFPEIYLTTDAVRGTAASFIRVGAAFMPVNAFLNASYFTLRSGGKTIITFIFDSVFIWCVSVTSAFILTRFTALPVVAVFTIVTSMEILKAVFGFILVKKGIWVQNIVS